MDRRIAVVGAGIAGLSAAESLARHGARVTVFEASERAGGRVATRDVRGCLLESGPDGWFAGTPSIERLVDWLGLGDEVVRPKPGWAGLVRSERVVPLPAHLWNGVPFVPAEIASAEALLPGERARLLAEPHVPAEVAAAPPDAPDAVAPGLPASPETLDAFLVRRLGAGAARRLVGPLLAGVHAGEAADLDAAAVAPALVAAEREYGSLLEAARRATAGAPLPDGRPLRSLRGGMGALVDALVERLEAEGVAIQCGAVVAALDRVAGEWRVLVRGATVSFEAIVLAVPPPDLARLLDRAAPAAASIASSVRAADARLVHLGVPAGGGPGSIAELHGAIVPPDEPGPISAFTLPARKWPDRAPAGVETIRASLRPGGDARTVPVTIARLLDLPQLPSVVAIDEVRGVWPVMSPGHPALVAALREAVAALPALAVVGAAWDGVGIGALTAAGERVGHELAGG